MIDLRNLGDISHDDRLTGINRALHSYPYFYSTLFDLTSGDTQFQEHRIGIDRDFYITGVQSKIDLNVTTNYNLSLYTGYYDSLTQTPYQQILPQSLLTYEAHESLIQRFCSKQLEISPRLIRRGDFVYVNLTADASVVSVIPIPVVLKGFAVLDGQTVSDETQANITQQLTQPVSYDWFNVRAEPATAFDFTKRTISIENDRFPRLILGAASELDHDNAATQMNISITDTARRLKLTNEPIPYSFLGPQMLAATVPDQGQQDYAYWFPVEYYWGPYAKIDIEVSYQHTAFGTLNLEFALLTRTV